MSQDSRRGTINAQSFLGQPLLGQGRAKEADALLRWGKMMKTRGTEKNGASAKRWRGTLPVMMQLSAGVCCCKCGQPIAESELRASAWGGEYICENCYYTVECVAIRQPEFWHGFRASGIPPLQ